ncbi:FAD-binding domain-containing protein, partial [Hoeflea sp.]
PDHVLAKAGVQLGETYPEPVVDHQTARNRALAAYQQIKDAA